MPSPGITNLEDNMINRITEIIKLINLNKGVNDTVSVHEGTHLRNDLGFDSLDLAELTVRIQKDFNIDVFEDGVVNTVSEILEKLNVR